MSKLKITQSMLKSFVDYKNGSVCGLVFKAQYMDKVEFPSSDVQVRGQVFEYLATGAKTKFGHIPEIKRTAKGEPTEPYAKIIEQSKRFPKIMKEFGFKTIGIGEIWSTEDAEGTLDLQVITTRDIHINDGMNDILIPKGTKCIIDIKTSGLLDDKWNPMGWHLDFLSEKEKLMQQPVHYKWLGKQIKGEDYPFFFMLFSNTNTYDCRIILVNVDESTIERHTETIEKAQKVISAEIKKGFEPHPSIANCKDCILQSNCSYFTDIPPINVVYYGG